eukprot:CAMPEP_0119125702 /NCGR_PEP_ID=MMETSP1310-20130426/4888_1 /TAXON_ID=464262 /ORGANISM="Genus nov. species nov., Strain RCC2339" /LENGTH=858 /DNA_ID=CAMNT_0007115797 /DNA_START=87 /DNA_END=2660 /DNA_ORIENTATION=-
MSEVQLDLIVVGAGFGGIHQLIRARENGLHAIALERWEGTGGTWARPNYPGAHCDIQCRDYSYSTLGDEVMDYKWAHNYGSSDEIQSYIDHVANRFNVRDSIRFGETVMSAVWNDETQEWIVRTQPTKGEGSECEYRARFFVLAVGCLSEPNIPAFARDTVSKFKGRAFHTARWPKEGVDVVTDKRVIVIGTGSSAMQASPEIAKLAKQVSVLQRTANYSIPNGFGEYESHTMSRAEVLAKKKKEPFGVDLNRNTKKFAEMTEEERRLELESRWGRGMEFIVPFADFLTDINVNRFVTEFANAKTREMVKDKHTAELLCPKYPIGCKRPSLSMNTDWWDHFNRDNVELVDVRTDPIEGFCADGIQLASGRVIEADVVVMATGFDAMTGSFFRINPVGRHCDLKTAWAHGAHSYLGVTTVGFPNMFWVAGPQSPSVLTAMVSTIETSSDFIIEVIKHLRAEGKTSLEPMPHAQMAWSGITSILANTTLLGKPECGSWYIGSNIPGKARAYNIYLGYDTWSAKLNSELESKLAAYVVRGAGDPAPPPPADNPLAAFDPSVANFLLGLKGLAAGQPDPPMTPEGQRAMYDGLVPLFGPGGNSYGPFEHRVNDNVVVHVYKPVEDPGAPVPVVLWLHAGGFVIGSHDRTHMAVARDLVEASGAVVVLVGYRLAPEHPYPAALRDAEAAYEWLAAHTEELCVDPSRIVVAGDSAGGTLATQLALFARDAEGRLPHPALQALFYPWLDLSCSGPSVETFAEAPLLPAALLKWMALQYLGEDWAAKGKDPAVSPLHVANHTKLPPAFIRSAQIDPLASDGQMYAGMLKSSGVEVDFAEIPGLPHAFLHFQRIFEPAGKAFQEFAA